ncbi:MAG: TRAP transporter small permease subunit [Alphaproteobacteria bacterium]|nr:TRAP transporter small permease subunit [Alphaproteobacteria bacterium]
MRGTLGWLRARADNVAVALLAAMFLSFILQIFTRYVINHPLGWTLEACLTAWLWLVFWGAAFVLGDRDHVRFDVLYMAAGKRLRRGFALASALAILAGFTASLPDSIDYITFYSIKSSATLGIRLDIVFSVYALFAVAVIVRYALRAMDLLRGRVPEATEEEPRA